MDRGKDGLTDMDGWADEQIDKQTNGKIGVWIDRQRDGKIDGRMDRQRDGRIDRKTFLLEFVLCHISWRVSNWQSF